MTRIALVVVVIAALSGTSASASYAGVCRSSLTRDWRAQVGNHPIDGSRHAVVLSIDIPIEATSDDYERAVESLKLAFPSFEVGFGSGILTGCCAMPVWGAVSLDEFAHLSDTRFDALCEVARRSRSSSAGVRVEFRETYEGRQGAAPYSFVRWGKRTTR
jgi:hypothetical protein